MVAEEGNISPDQVILSELFSTGFQRSFSDDDDLTAIADSDVVYAFQAPPLHSRGGSSQHSGYHHSLPSSPYTSTAGPDGQRLLSSGTLSSEYLNQGGSSKVLFLICNTAGSGQQAVRFGPPFLMREDRSISWDQLQQSILSKLYYLMLNGSQAQVMTTHPISNNMSASLFCDLKTSAQYLFHSSGPNKNRRLELI
nr:ubiquitin carboxyl-terminal hydrolase 43-like [Labrus bergylta]